MYINLGILAHVDAGKTSLTERLLHAAGAIDAVGSVDAGTTRTDSLDLERARGITIRAAAAAFTVGDVVVQLVDTPGHPDFIAEVDRSLRVLDGAVLVLSAVEGVQAQTVVLFRALRRLRVPTLLFVNKVDRSGADPGRVIDAVRERLTPDVVVLGSAVGTGTGSAEVVPLDWDDPGAQRVLLERLVEHDDGLLEAAVDGRSVPALELRACLARQTARCDVHPVLVGSAATGAGADGLVEAITTLLPAAAGDPCGPLQGAVFKVERSGAGEKLAWVRMRSGSVRVRDRVPLGSDRHGTVTRIEVLDHGATVDRPALVAGGIGRLSGLREVRVGDAVGSGDGGGGAEGGAGPAAEIFPPPTLESAVVATDPARQADLHGWLVRLAEQDPLIDLRQDDDRGGLFVSLYGEVQQGVLAQSVRADLGIEVEFRDTATICTERIVGTGRAAARLGDDGNPYLATLGMVVGPAALGTGVRVALDVDVTSIPMFVYRTVDAFAEALTRYVELVLRRGPAGWAVPDASVTLVECGYTSPASSARDFRKLTAVVLRRALAEAGTVVCEPIHRFGIDAPADALPGVLALLARLRGVPHAPSTSGRWCVVEGEIPATELPELRRRLHGLTHGEGVLEVAFPRYDPAPRR